MLPKLRNFYQPISNSSLVVRLQSLGRLHSLIVDVCSHCLRLGHRFLEAFLDLIVILPEGISFTTYAALNMLLQYGWWERRARFGGYVKDLWGLLLS